MVVAGSTLPAAPPGTATLIASRLPTGVDDRELQRS